jgi:hypothetical protein
LQARLLDVLFNKFNLKGANLLKNVGQKWAALLVSRTYFVKNEKHDIRATLRYAVGQPMGALSSWAMLALIHHFIVQVAAWEVGFNPNRLFRDYAVLGDDLVIANHRVARRYLQLLKELGVECGLHKSILSRKGKGLEFAKTTFIDKMNVSPISLDELSTSLSDLSTWAAFVNKFNLSWERQMRVLGYGYLARRKSFRKFNHAMQLVYLSQIAKVDFNTDVLRLNRRAPKDFDTIYLDIFKSKVLYPLFRRLFNLLYHYPVWLKDQLNKVSSNSIKSEFVEFDRYDIRNAFDLVIGDDHQAFPHIIHDIIKKLVAGMGSESQSALFYFAFDERTFNWLWPYLKVNTFNEALQLYFNLNSELGKLSLQVYGVDRELPRLPAKKLPLQAKIFRDWSIVSQTVISTFRASLESDKR